MSFSELRHDAPVEAASYGVILPRREIIHSTQSMPSFAVAKQDKPISVQTKRLFVKETKTTKKNAAAAEKTRSIAEFAKPIPKGSFPSPSPRLTQSLSTNVERPSDEILSDLTVEEIAYAALAQGRVVVSEKRGPCGNSPFCRETNHGHGGDETEFGRLEATIRKAADFKDRVGVRVLPPYPANNFECGLLKQKNTSYEPKHRMSNAEFSDGLKNDDLAFHVLAQWRIYFSEMANIVATTARRKVELEEQRQRHQLEANNAADRFVQLESVNKYYDEIVKADIGENLAQARLLQLSASQKLKHLLARHNMSKINVLQATLHGLMMSIRDYSKSAESEFLMMIRQTIRGLSTEEDHFDFDDDDCPPWKPIYDEIERKANQEAIAETISMGAKMRAAPAQQKANVVVDLTEEHTKKRSFAEMAQEHSDYFNPLKCYKAVCGSQFQFAENCNACTSICMNIAATLAQATKLSQEIRMSEIEYVNSYLNWRELVENGVNHWINRTNKEEVQEHVFDITRSGERAEMIRQRYDTCEYTGSLFATKTTPTTEAEKNDYLANPDLESAFDFFREYTGNRLPATYVMTFHNHAIAISHHSYGWHVFDSGGGTVDGKSVLFTVRSVSDVLKVVRHLFFVDQLDENTPGKRTLDEHRSYSLFCMTLKREN